MFIFTIEEIVKENKNLSAEVTDNFINSFVRDKDCKPEFNRIDDFNVCNATPILSLDNNKFYIAHLYTLYEAFYESPFYWMSSDKKYSSIASKNRGDFTENFAEICLLKVFDRGCIYKNINIYDGKVRVGEIDVLVVYAKFCIILQAKSKKLTLSSKQGNNVSLKKDFKLAIQDAYNQAIVCANSIKNEKLRLIDSNNVELFLDRDIKEFFPICVVSEHYPSLSVQAQQFIKYEVSESIHEPLITDIFFLDVLAEILNNPLYFLSYLGRRAEYFKRLIINQELSALGYHLRKNLYFDDNISMVMVDEDFTYAIDVAMSARRLGVIADSVPKGILTNLKGTQVQLILEKILSLPNYDIVKLGFLLLRLSEDYIKNIDKLILMNSKNCWNTGNSHDLTFKLDDKINVGLTIHINSNEINEAQIRLTAHANLRKYKEKSDLWFGLLIQPDNKAPKIISLLVISHGWCFDKDFDKQKNILKDKYNYDLDNNSKINTKIGRNEKCPCGSGVKYKKCCLIAP